jgi:glycosyltransferase involved in cell wall biosynthesis
MRILDVSPRSIFPPQRGSAVRVHNLLRHLSARHEVRQFSQIEPIPSPRHASCEFHVTPTYSEFRFVHPAALLLSQLCERNWVSAPVLSGMALRLLRPEHLRRMLEWAEVVLVEFPWQFEYCRRAKAAATLVLASHNVECQKFESYGRARGIDPSHSPWLRYIRNAEANAIKRADLVLAVSLEDRDELVRLYRPAPERVIEIRNGADTEKYFPVDSAIRQAMKRKLGLPDGPVVIYIGSNVPTNQAGLEWVLRLAAIMDRFTFVVIGPLFSKPGRWANLIATGRVEDVGPYFQAADISLCPIEYGGGTKIKLMEALATGLPSIAFQGALHGIRLVPGEHVLVAAQDTDAMLAELNRLIEVPGLAEGLGRMGRDFVCRYHDWRQISETLEQALLQLVSRPEGASLSQSRSLSARIRG